MNEYYFKQYYNNTVDMYAFSVITLCSLKIVKYFKYWQIIPLCLSFLNIAKSYFIKSLDSKCFSFYFSFSSSLINVSCAFVIFIVFAFLMSI